MEGKAGRSVARVVGLVALAALAWWWANARSAEADRSAEHALGSAVLADDAAPDLEPPPEPAWQSAPEPAPAVAPPTPPLAAPARTEEDAAPDGGVAVRVVGPDGNGIAGVGIAVGMRVPGLGRPRAIRLGEALSGADGRARMALDHDAREREAPFPPNPELMLDARVAGHRTRVRALLDDAQRTETVLRLPALRRVDVLVTLPDGSPAVDPVALGVRWAPADVPEEDAEWTALPAPEMNGPRGSFLAGHGLRLRLTAWDETRVRAAGSAVVPGPQPSEAEPVARRVALGEIVPRFRARFVDPDGRPMPGLRLSQYQTTIRLDEDGKPDPATEQTRWSGMLDVDATGRIDVPVVVNDRTRALQRTWHFVVASRDRSVARKDLHEEGAVQVSAPLPPALLPGQVHDAGDLLLRRNEHPLLVAGRVVGPDGQPVSALIDVETADDDWRQRERLWRGRPERDGSFAVRAAPPEDGRVRVSAGGFGWLGEAEVVAVGTTDVELVMRKGIDLRGRLLLEPTTAWMEYEIRMPGGRAKRVGPDGSFHVDYLHPGAEAWVSLEHNGRELWRSGPVALEGSGDLRPPQIQEVDLRGRFRTWEFRLMDDATGSPFAEHVAVQVHTPDGARNQERIDAQGVFRQVAATDAHLLRLHAQGYEPAEVSWPPPEEIALRKSNRK